MEFNLLTKVITRWQTHSRGDKPFIFPTAIFYLKKVIFVPKFLLERSGRFQKRNLKFTS
jgi:hypothetical protein